MLDPKACPFLTTPNFVVRQRAVGATHRILMQLADDDWLSSVGPIQTQPMGSEPFGRDELLCQLRTLGVREGSVVQVHCAYSEVAPVGGGPETLILSLMDAVGRSGTVVMPAMTSDDDTPFDARLTDCVGMGVVADTFWRMANVMRSDSPHSFAAVGSKAGIVTAPHDIENPHGPESPVGRVHSLDGLILLIGVGHESNTTIHLAEHIEGVGYRTSKYSTLMRNGASQRIYYTEPTCCCGRFALIDTVLDKLSFQTRGFVGNAQARLVDARSVVDAARHILARDQFAFLHPKGHCPECDLGWAGVCTSGKLGQANV